MKVNLDIISETKGFNTTMLTTRRTAKIIILFVLYALSSNGITVGWKDKCSAIKRNYLNSKALNIMFSPLPKINAKKKYYILKWNNISVPIPIDTYKELFISQHVSGKYELVLKTSTVTINLVIHKNELVHDVFATSSIANRKIASSQSGIKATNSMFGGPVRHSDLIMLGYKTTPANLKCQKNNKDSESGKLMALILKKPTGPDRLISVHRWKRSHQGWLSKSRSAKNLIYSAYIVKKSSPNIIQQINYTVPSKLQSFSLVYAVDNINSQLQQLPPKWLKLLNKALQSKNKNQWNNYISHVKQSTVSRRSIKFTVKNLKLRK